MSKFVSPFNRALLSAAVGLGAISAVQAHAGETPGTAEATDALGVADIVVTAQKREQRLQDVPISITVRSGDDLRSEGIASLRDIALVSPGVFYSSGGGNNWIYIRGIGPRGSNPGDESIVPTYIDGVYQPYNRPSFPEFNNIERMEVLKGPQGTVLGRNAVGGAINIVTKTPKPGFSGEAIASYGGYNEWKGMLYLTGGDDTVALDLALSGDTSDGYIYDPVRKVHYGDKSGFGVRSKAVVRPAETFTITTAISYAWTRDSIGGSYTPVGGNSLVKTLDPTQFLATRPYEANLSVTPLARTRQLSGSITAVWNGPSFDVTSITAGQRTRALGLVDADGTGFNGGEVLVPGRENSFIQELYAVSTGSGPLNWTAGATYFRDVAGVSGQRNPGREPIFTRSLANSFAGYLDLGYELADGLKLGVGGRYTKEKRDYKGSQGVINFSRDTSFDRFTPTAIVEYRTSPQFLAYARAGQAFKSGVYNTNSLTALDPVRPSVITSYEVGIKTNPTPRLQFNLAAYYNNLDDMQVVALDRDLSIPILSNAGKAIVYGIEFDSSYVLTPDLQLRAAGSFLRARYERFEGATDMVPLAGGGNGIAFFDASGNRLDRVPRVQLSGGVNFDRDYDWGSVGANVNVNYSSAFFYDPGNRFREAARTLVNAEVSWSPAGSDFKLVLWGQNLTNEFYYHSAVPAPFGDLRVFGKPRTYGVRAEMKF